MQNVTALEKRGQQPFANPKASEMRERLLTSALVPSVGLEEDNVATRIVKSI